MLRCPEAVAGVDREASAASASASAVELGRGATRHLKLGRGTLDVERWT